MIQPKIVRRLNESDGAQWLVPITAIFLSLIVGAVFLEAYGYSAITVYNEMLMGAFGSSYAFSETIVKAIPLMMAGLAVAIAFRMRIWNIGAEGQIYAGAFAASGFALFMGDLPAYLLLPLMLVSAFAAGACWGMIPGALKAFWNVNETITTLMLNYVAILWVNYLVFGPWKDPNGFNFPLSRIFSSSASLPTIGFGRVHMGIFIVLVLALFIWVLLRYSKWGYEIRVIGDSPEAARYAGMNIARNILLVMAVSGGIAGMAGMLEVAGVTHRLQQGLSPGYGFTGIIVAWLARLNPYAIIFVSILFGGLLVAGYSVQTLGLPFSVVSMLQGLILFFILGGEIFITHRLILVRKGK